MLITMRSMVCNGHRFGAALFGWRQVCFVALATLSLNACSESTDPSRAPRYIQIRSPLEGVPVGRTMQLDVVVTDELSRPVTYDAVEWRTSPQGRATISAAGLMTGISVGMVEVTATVRGVSETDTLYVKPDAPLFHGAFARAGHLCQTIAFFGDPIILSDGLIEFIDDTLLIAAATNYSDIPVTYYRVNGETDDDLNVGRSWSAPEYSARLYGTDSIEFPLDIWYCDGPSTTRIFRFESQ